MHRQHRNIILGGGRQCKIRKRPCSSSSSSSSHYRLKRPILRLATPVLNMNSSSRSPYNYSSTLLRIPQSPIKQQSQNASSSRGGGGGGKQQVSARKLAATLWEMNQLPSPTTINTNTHTHTHDMKLKKEILRRDKTSTSKRSSSLPPHLSDPSHTPTSDRMDPSGNSNARLRLTDAKGFDCFSAATLMEIEMRSRSRGGPTPTTSVLGMKSRCLKDLSTGLNTSKQLLKILNRLWGSQEQNSSSTSLISALHAELERALVQVDILIREQRSDKHELDYLVKRLSEEKTTWKLKERERTRGAIETIAGDLEVERKLRRRSESLNKKLGVELAETKAALSRSDKELEREKRAREIMEQICNDLATGIEEDKEEVEDLKKESAKVKEEVEKEREMLQLADMLREERLQMKLSEAKYQFEEKNAAVDKLRSDLETFLRAERFKEIRGVSENRWNNVDVDGNLGKSILISDHNEEKGMDAGEIGDGVERPKALHSQEEEDGDSAAESDLHSIELNMDNISQSYKWSYNNGVSKEDPRRLSVEETKVGRKSTSTSSRTQRGSFSHERRISEGVDWDFSAGNLSDWGVMYNQQRFSELESQNGDRDYMEEALRYKSVKGLRDQILSDSRTPPSRGCASPTRQWAQPWSSRDNVNVSREKPSMVRESSLKGTLVEARLEARSRNSRQ
ncbi:hypothetical protein GIB67_038325 [Kingdonia uniflora]|uniref:Uncharacterized protein n=1 Tax=Kingdonia uniflora TaxID=39325 RepID=A0A7J7KUN4_9MAGN|nr:hypothetical protein GIB67_038325 [Kingdonia uniflora]